MDSDLLNLPIGVKIPVKPGTKPVFCRGKVGEKLHQPFPYFTLDDPYNHHLTIDYNCLHDPHLRDYHKREDVLKLLRRRGFVTSDNKVVCTLKEFNQYRDYLTRHKLFSEQMSMRKEECIQPPPAKSKHGTQLPGATNASRPGKRWMQTHKPYCPPPPKRRETTRKLRQSKRVKAALDEDQTYTAADLGQEDATLPGSVSTGADSQGKPDIAADGQVKAVSEQLTAAEAQKLKELVETVVLRVFGKLKVPQDKRVNFLKNAAQGIRGTSSGMRAQPLETPQDHCQEMETVAQELVATVLEMLGDHLESQASDQGAAASLEEQPVDGGATQADKSEEAETATSHRACLEACLDKLTGLVVKNVRNLLKSMVASQFGRDSSGEHTEILELPKGQASNIQPEPSQTLSSKQGMEARRGFPRASERRRQEASKGTKLPPLQPKRRAEGTGYAKTLEPEVLATVKESLENEEDATTSGNTLDIRTMAKQIIQSAIQRICQCRPAPTPEEDFKGTTASQGGKESSAAEDTLPSVGRRISRQPVPPAGPKPPARAGARRRAVRPKPV
ncbi:uncharacterized protein LOC113986927 [Pipra filicauda]|uniref:Uncharacterized protein LOC113986927 n=1 Tax=Pipra filicauda TaxID=649802 RepID=A0A6J2GHU1_9PASS|nr:uncharacterized protein LOC113986927 [Pipra filicauda]